jgi:hypothetical protein
MKARTDLAQRTSELDKVRLDPPRRKAMAADIPAILPQL